MGSERVDKILDSLFGEVELVRARMGEKGFFGTKVRESEGRGGSGRVWGRTLLLEICVAVSLG